MTALTIARILMGGGLTLTFIGLLIGVFRPYAYEHWIVWGSATIVCAGYVLFQYALKANMNHLLQAWGIAMIVVVTYLVLQFSFPTRPALILAILGFGIVIIGTVGIVFGIDTLDASSLLTLLLPITMLIMSLIAWRWLKRPN